MRFTLDTNILVYAHDSTAGERHHSALRLVLSARSGRGLVLTLQCLAELFRVLTWKKGVPVDDAIALIDDFQAVVEIAAADSECLSLAMRNVAQHGVSFWDAMLWATAAKAGCSYVLTEDGQHGRLFDGVTLVDPFRPESAPLLRRLVGGAQL